MTEVKLDVLYAGDVTMPAAYARRPEGSRLTKGLPALLARRGKPITAPLLAFVAHHPEHGPIVIDTGLHPDARQSLTTDYGRILSVMFRTLKPADHDFARQLHDAGAEPGDVTQAVMTHLHVDHTSGMRLLPNAEFVVARQEWAAATARGARFNGYAAHHLPDAARIRQLDIQRDGVPYGPFARTHDLLGDGSIRLVSTPGHTKGHLSVLVASTRGEVLIVGDAAYTRESIRDQTLPFLTASDSASRRTLHELKAYTDAKPDAIVIPTHDPDAYRALSDVGVDAERAQALP